MNDSIIFVPICPICHHDFNHIDVGMDFSIICPDCDAVLNDIKYPDFNKLYKQEIDGKPRFVYNQSNCY